MFNRFLLLHNSYSLPESAKDYIIAGSSQEYVLYSNKSNFKVFPCFSIFIDGYTVARHSDYEKYKICNQFELVLELYNKYGLDFVEHLKGIFCIVIITNSEVYIYSDHLGIYKIFYKIENGKFTCSNDVNFLNISLKFNPEIIGIKSLLNHEINGYTIFKGVHYTTAASFIKIEGGTCSITNYFNIKSFIEKNKEARSYRYFADLLSSLINQYHNYFKPGQSIISLTGGKDSRTALAALLSNGIHPIGLTYGNPESRDAVYSAYLAKKSGIPHYIFNPDDKTSWYDKASQDIIQCGNPLINIHRAHRFNAFREINKIVGNNVSYYAGYMGGEILMGIYYDNLIFSNFLTNTWDNRNFDFTKEISNGLIKRFVHSDRVDISNIEHQLSELSTFNISVSKQLRQFYGLFEIGVLHHSQDIYLSSNYFKYAIPFFLDIDFLESLFGSYYTFFYQDNKTNNLLKRYHLYEFNMNIQHILYPDIDSVYFAKKGSYNTLDFLKGPLYWSFIKGMRYLTERKKYPPSFAYTINYKNFLISKLNEILLDKKSEIHEYYRVQDSLNSLSNSNVLTSEEKLQPYSSIVMHYLQIQLYK